MSSSGGSFLPGLDYTVGGVWTFVQNPVFSGGGGSFASPAITGTVTGGASYTAPTLTSPTITGTTAIGAGATLTSPTLVTPTLGVATATSVNKLTLTAPATSATLTLIDGTTVTGPAATGTLVTATGTATLTNKTVTGAISSDYAISSVQTYAGTVTPALITGFSWPVVVGTYVFNVNLPCTMTTNGGLTVSFVLTTATLSAIQYQSYASTATDNATAVSTTGTTTTSTTKVFDSKTAAYTYVRIWGSMTVSLAGTFQWDGTQNTSAGGGDTTTILAGAWAQLTRVS